MTTSCTSYNRPFTFFALATALPWALWLLGGWLSHRDQPLAASLLALAGLTAPLAVVAWVTRDAPDVRADMWRRLGNFRESQRRWPVLAVLLMPGAVLAATAISLAFGYPVEQFLPRGGTTFSVGVFSGWFVLVAGAVIEELAWHSYGTDALRSRLTLFTTSLIFAGIWAFWHVPLAFFDGSAQAQTVDQGAIHALNFPLSLLPFVLLMNWIYCRGHRNIMLAVLFHLGANLSTQVLATHPDTEIIATGVLLAVTAAVLWFERELFFRRGHHPLAGPTLS
ncbi:CPBP family intramembrane glutamic endopeptidase [Corynebacterium guangdongense]|uniref:Membrane protease YdiL (CAAX protease family) n=1 Tax=Corynebacterium guangdongense TaxID=1783348 RepID=A0ABU1ZYW6_9CORY|nr:CPBP family intramembrane glutamic endopeptidase [Corynebacterium guangdongense]MDR7330101.1 membrane protease YdiL (CAAX protease family) [Corynebacterium guangdongense]WJZ18659.1 CAAX amino terminal protease self- immunity [Corynebacterium guangdongense]